ncbi:MAG: hypothetical protein ACLRI8_06140 [Agathobacter rectalis]
MSARDQRGMSAIPGFFKLVESYGGHGIRVEKEEDIDAAFAEARNIRMYL